MKLILIPENQKTKAPWGEFEGELGQEAETIKYTLAQLIFYKNDGRIPSQHLLNDINGYEEILSSRDPNINAREFLKAKQDYIMKGKRFSNNLDVIELLKSTCVWH